MSVPNVEPPQVSLGNPGVVTLKDALSNCEEVWNIPLPSETQSNVDAAPQAICYNADFNSHFSDLMGYKMGLGRYAEEAESYAALEHMLEEGQQYTTMLYTWRCCTRAIPQIKSHDQPNRMEIYQTTVQALEENVEQLRKFMHFQKDAVAHFCEEVKKLCNRQEKEAYSVSQQYLLTLGKMINMFAMLDELKNIRASIRNDYSAYRRAAEIIRKNHDMSQVQESQELSMFLGTHNSIRTLLKMELTKITGYEDPLCDIVNTCLTMFENHTYMLPEEKHMLVKAVGFGLFLVDGTEVNINRLDGRRKISLSKIDKLFKKLEVVPLYGDMMIAPFSYIQCCPNYDESRWPHCTAEEENVKQMNLPKQIPSLREEHNQLMCDLALQSSRRSSIFTKKSQTGKPEARVHVLQSDQDIEHRELYNLALHSVQQLSNWTATLTELFSWKLVHPTDHKMNPNCPTTAEEYERATRYNYNKEEKFAMTEVIAFIKGVQSQLIGMESQLQVAITQHMYAELQDFVQLQLREPLRKAVKHKKEILKSILIAIRDCCIDWLRGDAPTDDPMMRGKKDSETNFKIDVPRKSVAPSSTQFYMVRCMLASLVDKAGKKPLRKDLDTQTVSAIENFLRISFFWPYLINFSATLQSCCDLSQLWFREFFLEITMGDRIQFPIEMSMPWILTDHILETKDPAMIEYVFYPLDLYNDSAHYALHHFKKQFLYDEIEAEVNLCFDQLVYKLSDQVFAYYKLQAASIVLDKKFQNLCKKHGLKVTKPTPTKYSTLLNHRRIQLLGRSIDLHRLVSQRINASLLKCLDTAIGRFELGDITGIVELDGLLEVNHMTHKLLSQHLSLDSFELLLHEANHSITVPCGRITLYLFFEINYNFLPHYCYNAATSRFVKTVYPLVEIKERDKPPNISPVYLWGSKSLGLSFTTIFNQFADFVGTPHFESMVHLLTYQDIAVILRELLEVIKNVINQSLVHYHKALMEVLPKRIIIPRYEYGSPGILEFYQATLVDIMNYSDLQPKVFQSLRELGNAILFCLQLTHSLAQYEVHELKQSAPFQNIIPKPHIPKADEMKKEERDVELKKHIKQLESKYRNQQVAPVITKMGTKEQGVLAMEHSVLTREKLCMGLSIFEVILGKIRGFLTSDIWHGIPPANGIISVDDNCEFHRFWSAIQFVFCIPPRSAHEYTVEQLFGEGLNWAGCTLITLLGQQRRYECLDFSYHLLKVNRVDQKDQVVKGVPLKKMMDRIRKFQILNNQIFAVLNKYLHQDQVVKHLEPPQPEVVLDETEVDDEVSQSVGCRDSMA